MMKTEPFGAEYLEAPEVPHLGGYHSSWICLADGYAWGSYEGGTVCTQFFP